MATLPIKNYMGLGERPEWLPDLNQLNREYFMGHSPMMQQPIDGVNNYRSAADYVLDNTTPGGSLRFEETPSKTEATDFSPYIGAAMAGIGLAADTYNTADSYTRNTYKARSVKVPTSPYGLGMLSEEEPLPIRTGYDYGRQDFFRCGGKMGRKYGHGGGYWADALGQAVTGAAAGTMIAPGIGTIVGAGLGLGASILGNEIRNYKAEKEADLYNAERREEEANRAYALGIGAGQIGRERNSYFNRYYVHDDGGMLHGVMSGGNGVTEIKNGGTHEGNPLGGVPMGVAPDGMPNLVEESEVKWDKENYIFSNRLKPTKRILKDNVLTDKRWEGKTYAEIAKSIQSASEERENDPVATQTVDEMLGRLMSAQETTRMEKQAKEIQKMVASMSPEEISQLMASAPMGMPQGMPAMPPQGMPMQMAPQGMEAAGAGLGQEPIMGEPLQQTMEQPMMAYGGHMYPVGGSLTFDFTHGGWGSENGAAWNGSTDAAWIEALALAAKDNVDLAEQNANTVADYIRKTKSYQQGTEWLQKDEENRRRYLASIVQSKDAPAAAKNFAKRFVNDKGEWKDGAKRDYESIYGRVRATHPGTYWKTPNEIIAEMTTPTAPAEPAAPATPVEDPRTGVRYYIRNGNNYELIGPQDVYNNWVLSHAQYSTPYQFRTSDEDGVKYTDYFVTAPEAPAEKIPFPEYSPWPGIANSGVALLGAWNRPDYEKANIIDSFRPVPADYTPIGDYLAYDPMDINYMTNVLRGQGAGTRASIRNRISPSIDAALLSEGFNEGIALGDAYQKAREYNQKERQLVAEFNRGTDQYNATAANEAQRTNFGLNGLDWERTKAYADARDAATSIASQANSAAVTSAMQNLNESYKDWYNTEGLGWLVQNGVYPGVEYRKRKA